MKTNNFSKIRMLLLSVLLVLPWASYGQNKELLDKIDKLVRSSSDSAIIMLGYADSLAELSDNINFKLYVKSHKGHYYWLSEKNNLAKGLFRIVLIKADQTKLTHHKLLSRHWLSMLHSQAGKLDSALYYSLQAESIANENWNEIANFLKEDTYTHIGLVYLYLKDYEKSVAYYKKSLKYVAAENKINRSIKFLRIAQSYLEAEKADSFIIYRDLYNETIFGIENAKASQYHTDGIYKYFLGDVNIEHLVSILPRLKQNSKPFQIGNTYKLIAQEHFKLGNYESAITAADSAILYVRSSKLKIDPLYVRHKALYESRQYDKAYLALQEYQSINSKFINETSIANVDRLNVEFETAKKEKEIANQELRLTRSKNSRNILLGVSGLFILLSFGIWQVYKRNKIAASLDKTIYEKHIAKVNLASLRSQMNPHFLFNTLNSINWYIIKNKPSEASKYLTKFSKLMRLILENSKEEKITLSKELETLKLYVEMEALRFEGEFEYELNITQDIDQDNTLVPPLLLQPFVENSIWHGLLHKEGVGHIRLNVDKEKGLLLIRIEDDGIGREQAQLIKNKTTQHRESSGIKITTDRIKGLNKNQTDPISIIDLQDNHGNSKGTTVQFKVPLQTVNNLTIQ